MKKSRRNESDLLRYNFPNRKSIDDLQRVQFIFPTYKESYRQLLLYKKCLRCFLKRQKSRGHASKLIKLK